MNHVMGHFYSETQFGKDLELNVVRIWVLHRVSLPKPANSLSRKEHLLRSGGSGALATLWGHICPLRQRREVLSSYLCPPGQPPQARRRPVHADGAPRRTVSLPPPRHFYR